MQTGWDDVRHFLALAKAGGLGKAADALGVSHVTVMRRIRTLEAALGSDLFVRRHDGHRLTEAGVELLQGTREGGDLIAQALERAASNTSRPRRVRITTTEIVANWILLPYLGRVGALPRLEIDASPREHKILDEEATIAVRFRRPSQGPFRIRRLATLDVAFYVSIDTVDAESLGYVGWSGEFEDIGLSRWLRQYFGDKPPVIALGRVPGRGVGAVGKSPAVATAGSLA